MTDYRLMYDSEYLYAVHLGGRELTLTIVKVKPAELVGENGRKAKKPVVYFEGKKLGLALNKTNGKAVASMYGPDTRKWIGKRITIYPTTTRMAGEVVDCIRVRPTIPGDRPDPGKPTEPTPQREPGDDSEEIDRARSA